MRWLLVPTLCLGMCASRAQSAPTPLLTPEAATLVGTYRLTYRPDSTNQAAKQKAQARTKRRNNPLELG